MVSGLRQDFMLKPGTAINLVSGSNAYTLASNILQLKKVTLSYDGSNSYVAYRKDLNEISNLNAETESQSAPKYTFINQPDNSASIIQLHPTPDASVTSGLSYWYIARPAALATTTQIPVTPDELHPNLVQIMVRDLKQRDGDATGMRLAETEIQKMNEEYKLGLGQRNIDSWDGFYASEFSE